MKLPVTDQFLWDVFNIASHAEDTLRFLIHPPKSMGDIALMIDDPIYQKYYKKLHPKKFAQLIYRLKKHNYIRVQSIQGNRAFILTKRGLDKVLLTQFKLDKDRGEKRKDGKWIMLIFDVPEKWKKSRELLRSILYNLGYKMFQQSVWITPYDVAEKTEMLLQEYSLEKFTRLFLIEEIKG